MGAQPVRPASVRPPAKDRRGGGGRGALGRASMSKAASKAKPCRWALPAPPPPATTPRTGPPRRGNHARGQSLTVCASSPSRRQPDHCGRRQNRALQTPAHHPASSFTPGQRPGSRDSRATAPHLPAPREPARRRRIAGRGGCWRCAWHLRGPPGATGRRPAPRAPDGTCGCRWVAAKVRRAGCGESRGPRGLRKSTCSGNVAARLPT